jgi:dTDP-4-amino-4,6-dideoxygalactose transaminase
MKPLKVATAVGTRPQFIKAVAVSRIIVQHNAACPERAITERILMSGCYILGPEVEMFEREVAAYLGVRHAISVANGTDALWLALRAVGVGHGDKVLTTPFTRAA